MRHNTEGAWRHFLGARSWVTSPKEENKDLLNTYCVPEAMLSAFTYASTFNAPLCSKRDIIVFTDKETEVQKWCIT